MSTRILVLIIVAPFMVAAMSCHPPVSTASTTSPTDTLTGIVSVTGTSFEQRLVLRSGGATVYLSAATPDSAALSRLGGVEVLVRGKQGGTSFRVRDFTARSVAGAPVVDGVVRSDGGQLSLQTPDGPIPLGNPPTALRGMIGARIWISGPLDRGPNSYGVIVPAA